MCESKQSLHERQKKFLNWIKQRPEKNICVVSHSSFIGELKDGVIGDENNELKHCFPYKLKTRFDSNKNLINNLKKGKFN